MADHEHYTKEQMIEALKESNGFISVAARRLGCSVTTVANYRDKYPEIQQVVDDIIDSKLDFAEGQLMANIKAGKEISLLFFLKTIGKRRGFIERQELDLRGMVKIDTIIDAMEPEQRERFIRSLEKKSE